MHSQVKTFLIFMQVFHRIIAHIFVHQEPHLSNHPLQNSEHIFGAFGRTSPRRLNWLSMLAPVPKFMVQVKSSRPLLRKLEDQSHWKSSTLSKPLSFTMSRMALTQADVLLLQEPPRQTAHLPFCTNVWTRTHDDVHAFLLFCI